MEFFFAGIVLGLGFYAIRDELRSGGLLDWRGRADDDHALAELLEFPVPDGWNEDDVLRTYAEISAL